MYGVGAVVERWVRYAEVYGRRRGSTHRGNSHASQLMDAFLVWKRPSGLVVTVAMAMVVVVLVIEWWWSRRCWSIPIYQSMQMDRVGFA